MVSGNIQLVKHMFFLLDCFFSSLYSRREVVENFSSLGTFFCRTKNSKVN